MKNWFDSLANANFMPHGHCYLWRPDILWTHVVSDLIIAFAYYAIPFILALIYFKQRKNLPFQDILLLFIAFIVLCGTTHLVEIYVTWVPIYEFQGWLKAITALVSITTAAVLIPKLPTLWALPGIEIAYQQSLLALEEVKLEKEEMQALYNASLERENRILELKNEVNRTLIASGLPPKYKSGE